MNYKDTLDYLFAQLPMFHRIGAAAYKANLDNTHAICDFLDHPENKFRSVHIAGTNGKGSTSHMLAAILQSAGYKTGLYTSPHLIDFRERIRINGEMIPEKIVISFVEKYREQFEKIKPSFFEWTVGLAFDYFANEKVEIAVIETGLGGRLDSTNVIVPELSVITNIGWDHANLLGDSLIKIAKEKAGIIKQNIPVVIGEVQAETAQVFSDKAFEMNSSIVFAEILLKSQRKDIGNSNQQSFDIFSGKHLLFENLVLDLPGLYQRKNIITVIETVLKLREAGYSIEDKHVREGLSAVRNLTGLMGRWQILSNAPLTICDVGHNEDGIHEVLNQLTLTPHDDLHFVFGVVNDKDISSILSLLPVNIKYYFCKANLPRALDAIELKNKAAGFGLNGLAYNSVAEAFHAAKTNAQEKDLIFIGGSTFVVAEVLQVIAEI
ncbi:MAG: bifunctional folylpolyglutamate synthase/dihydrofolate synthase [Bacteroidetes bacterium]|nr:bifunctional folylpolyglutamate synthase/dihydrofolate synthase [Bacteroidota bacterium]